jgi:hypothetical protein
MTAANLSLTVQPSGPASASGRKARFARACARHLDGVIAGVYQDRCRMNLLSCRLFIRVGDRANAASSQGKRCSGPMGLA